NSNYTTISASKREPFEETLGERLTMIVPRINHFEKTPGGIVTLMVDYFWFKDILDLRLVCKHFYKFLSTYSFHDSVVRHHGTWLNRAPHTGFEVSRKFIRFDSSGLLVRISDDTRRHLKEFRLSWDVRKFKLVILMKNFFCECSKTLLS